MRSDTIMKEVLANHAKKKVYYSQKPTCAIMLKSNGEKTIGMDLEILNWWVQSMWKRALEFVIIRPKLSIKGFKN